MTKTDIPPVSENAFDPGDANEGQDEVMITLPRTDGGN